jgi:hypothetical protein
MKELPQYQCHKVVRAIKIGKIEINFDKTATLFPEEKGWEPFIVSADYVARARPESGGYFVVYEDGYESYSPCKAFEDGYSRI